MRLTRSLCSPAQLITYFAAKVPRVVSTIVSEPSLRDILVMLADIVGIDDAASLIGLNQAVEALQHQGSRCVPSPARFEHRLIKDGLREHFPNGIWMQEIEHVFERIRGHVEGAPRLQQQMDPQSGKRRQQRFSIT